MSGLGDGRLQEQVKCPKCGEQKGRWSNCNTCHKREREEYETKAANRAAALLNLGFSEPVLEAAMFGFSTEWVTCLTCGAGVPIVAAVEGREHPLDLHRAWHA